MKEGRTQNINQLKNCWKTLKPVCYKANSHIIGNGSDPNNFLFYEIPSAGQETEKHSLKRLNICWT